MTQPEHVRIAVDEGTASVAASLLARVDGAWRLLAADAAPAAVGADALARSLVRAVLGREGLGLAEMPKGLIPFHRTPDGGRTPFEEHLVEGARTVRDKEGRCRIHFTV